MSGSDDQASMKQKVTGATPLKQAWTGASLVSRVGYTVRGSDSARGSIWSDNPPGGVVVKLLE